MPGLAMRQMPQPRASHAPVDGCGAPVRAAQLHEGRGQSTLTNLAVQANQGDDVARNELMRCARSLVLRYARARMPGIASREEAAQDAAQEACLSLLRALPGYRPDRGPVEAMVYSIAARRVVDQLREHYRAAVPVEHLPESTDPDPTPEQSALSHDAARRVRAMLQRLPEQQREVLTLRVAVGMSTDEVAAALGMTAVGVRVSQHRALNRLRRILDDERRAKESVAAVEGGVR